jgi:hypothetical protein
MFVETRKLLILVFVLTLSLPLLYAQEAQEEKPLDKGSVPDTAFAQEEKSNCFLEFINKKAYADTINEKDEKKILREKWRKLLRVDIFYPYFRAKQVEEWVRDKASVDFFDLKGRPKFENNQIKYIFKAKF